MENRKYKKVNVRYSLGKMSEHKIYKSWTNIKQRCTNSKYPSFKDYGARGIKIYEKWLNDFFLFYNYIMLLSNAMEDGYTIDRINNDGNYEPGNIRWADNHLQQANRGKMKCNKTGYTGVFKLKSNKYRIIITVNKRQIYLGAYDTPEEAAKVRDKYITDNNLNEYPLSGLNSILF